MGDYLNYCWDNCAGATSLSETSMNDTCCSCVLGSAKDEIQPSWLRPLGCFSLTEGKYLSIMQRWAVPWLIASISFRLSKHWSHTGVQQRWTLFYPKPGKFGTDKPDGQNDEYPPFAIHPQAVLNCFLLTGQPALLGQAQRQPSPFSGADNKKYTYPTEKTTSVTHSDCSSQFANLCVGSGKI